MDFDLNIDMDMDLDADVDVDSHSNSNIALYGSDYPYPNGEMPRKAAEVLVGSDVDIDIPARIAGELSKDPYSDYGRYLEVVYNCRPYYFLVTLTFLKSVVMCRRWRYTETLLRYFNSALFGLRNKRHDYTEGFAFTEVYPLAFEVKVAHTYLLIKEHPRYFHIEWPQFIDKFKTALSKATNFSGYPMFKEGSAHIQRISVEEEQALIWTLFNKIPGDNFGSMRLVSAHEIKQMPPHTSWSW